MKSYSTKRTAQLAGIHWMTLYRWMNEGKVKPSIVVPLNGRSICRWTDRDVERIKKFKAAHYRKGRDRKKKA